MVARPKMPFTAWTPDTASIYNDGEETIQNCLPYLQAPNYSQSPGLSLTAIGNVNGSNYLVNAVKFNGTSNWLNNAGLTSIANSKKGSLSCWIRLDSNADQYIFTIGSGPKFRMLLVSGQFQISALNSSNVVILGMHTTLTYSSGSTWYNILASWDLSTATTNLYINSVSDKTTSTATNDTINYADTAVNTFIGRANAGSLFSGALAELWFDPTSTIDFTNASNRAKFISGGFPVNLGSDGSTPTGTAPIVYLKSMASVCGTNSGTGGNFTQNGTFAIASSAPSDASPTQYSGSISVIDSGNSPHTYAGTTNKLVEITATTANNVSKSGGYANTTFWKFAQFGNTVYATDYADNVQSMTVGGTAFADLAGSPPKAKAIAQIGQFIMLGNTNGGTYGGSTAGAVPTRTWWCQIGNPANWPDPLTATGIADQAGVNDLLEIYGEVRHITNGQQWGLVFQEHAISQYYYVGGNVVFQINTYEKQRGLYCPNGACQIGSLVYFIDSSGFFVTDGSSVEPIGHDQVDNTWLSDVNTAYLDHVRASHDAQNKCIWWSYVSTTATLQGSFVSCDKVIVYNYADKRWGLGYTGQTIDMIFDSHTLGYTMEQLDSVNSNLDLITPSLDSPYWNGGLPIVGAFGISLVGGTTYASYYGTFTGAALTATLQTKTVNLNTGGRAFVTAVKPIVIGATPSNITVQLGQQVLPTDTVTYSTGTHPETRTGKCSQRSDAVFHSAKVTISGGFTNALGVEPEFRPSGYA
jgi:hypothetical protein